jgi:hypothetical protein
MEARSGGMTSKRADDDTHVASLPELRNASDPHEQPDWAAHSVAAERGHPLDARHVFLDAHDVMARYGWGKTKGYQNLKDRQLVPAPVMTHPNRWRLDQLLDWEERRMAAAEAECPSFNVAGAQPTNVADLLPRPKRRRRSA